MLIYWRVIGDEVMWGHFWGCNGDSIRTGSWVIVSYWYWYWLVLVLVVGAWQWTYGSIGVWCNFTGYSKSWCFVGNHLWECNVNIMGIYSISYCWFCSITHKTVGDKPMFVTYIPMCYMIGHLRLPPPLKLVQVLSLKQIMDSWAWYLEEFQVFLHQIGMEYPGNGNNHWQPNNHLA